MLCAGVSEKLSHWERFVRGFSSGAICVIWVSASSAQPCGFLHPFRQSLAQFMHVHIRLGKCWLDLLCCTLFDICIRSATVLTLCLFSRHFVAIPIIGPGWELIWNQAGSLVLMSGVIRRAARFILYFLAVFIILTMSLFKLVALGPLLGGFQLCVYVLILVRGDMFGGAVLFMRRSVMIAQVGWVREKFR